MHTENLVLKSEFSPIRFIIGHFKSVASLSGAYSISSETVLAELLKLKLFSQIAFYMF